MNTTLSTACAFAAFLVAVAAAPASHAQGGFAAAASPPRFEIKAKPGVTSRQVIEIQHAGLEPGRYRIYTNDWTMRDDLALDFSETLQPNSCRPWVALERRELSLPSNGKHRFRFEITPPADAPAGECRFAIMIEGTEPAQVKSGAISMPVAARLGVIVYVAIGEVAPRMVIGAGRIGERDKQRVPVFDVTNEGNAHGRIEGFLQGKDADGREFEMYPEDVPIMPGRTREIALREDVPEGKPAAPLKFPLSVKGSLEWGGKRQSFDMRFAP